MEHVRDSHPHELFVHIGPHKTGTTSIQEALHRARRELRAFGIAYLHDEGRVNLNVGTSELIRLVRAGKIAATGTRAPRRMAAVLRSANQDRMVISAEHLSSLRDDELAAFANALLQSKPTHRVRVIITLRRIDKMIPSLWQQSVRGRVMPSLGEWTKEILTDPNHKDAFRVDHIGLISRWAGHFGASAVTVIVADDEKPRGLYDAFERTLGLPSGTLVEGRIANRSLNFQQAELIRAAHRQMLAAGMMQPAVLRESSGHEEDHDDEVDDRELRYDVDSLRWPYMRISREMCRTRSSIPGDPIVLPREFFAIAVRRAEETIKYIKEIGVVTIGELDALRPKEDPRVTRVESQVVCVTPEQAAELVVSALHAVGVSGAKVDSRYLEKVSTAKLFRLLVKRALPWSARAKIADRGPR